MILEIELREAIEALTVDQLDRMAGFYASFTGGEIRDTLGLWYGAIGSELLREVRRREGISDPPDEGSVVIAAAMHMPGKVRAGALEAAARTAQEADSATVRELHRVLADILRNARQDVSYN